MITLSMTSDYTLIAGVKKRNPHQESIQHEIEYLPFEVNKTPIKKRSVQRLMKN